VVVSVDDTVVHWLPVMLRLPVELPHGDCVGELLTELHAEDVEEMLIVGDRVLVLLALAELEVVTLMEEHWDMVRVRVMVRVPLMH